MDFRTLIKFRLFLWLIAITITGCATSQTETPTNLPPTKFSTAVITKTNQVVLYNEEPGEGFPNDAAKIITIALENNILKVTVAYHGGCQEHTFELYAWTAFLASDPPQGVLYLSHDAHGDRCTDNVEELLLFDLTPLNKERNDPGEYPLLLRVFEPTGESFAVEPFMPLVEWP